MIPAPSLGNTILLAVVVFLFGAWAIESCQSSDAVERAERAQEETERWRGKAEADSAEVDQLRAAAARTDTVYLAAVDTFRVLDSVWVALPDSAPADTVRAVAEAAISACRSALDACAVARAAQAEVILGLDRVATDLRGEAAALRVQVAALEVRAAGSFPWDLAIALPGGCAVGWLADGIRGCAIGAGVGGAGVVTYRGIRDLIHDLQ